MKRKCRWEESYTVSQLNEKLGQERHVEINLECGCCDVLTGYAFSTGEMTEPKPYILSTPDGQLTTYHQPEYSSQGQVFDGQPIYSGSEHYSPLSGMDNH